MDDNYKEVYFVEYCKTCKHLKKTEEDEPCCDCVSEPVNLYSHKPVKYDKK